MISLETIASSVIRSISEYTSFCVVVFWMQDDGDRDKVCYELGKKLAGTRVIPHVLRSPIFRDPNAWAGDAISVLELLRERVLQIPTEERDSPLGLVVISRSKLNVSQASSPAIAPEWFPTHGGREVTVFARDVQSIAACSLASDEACLPSIKSLLFQLEMALLKIASQAAARDRHHGQKLWNQLLKERSKLELRSHFLDNWRNGIETITDPESYRPSLMFGWSMISAMWDTFLTASPAQLFSKSEAFAEFLEIDASWLSAQPDPNALLPILFRGPEDHLKSPELITARGLVLTVGLACQFITAAAHADQYGRVSAPMLNALSRELRSVLTSVENKARWHAQLP